jgi:hypothetical protein
MLFEPRWQPTAPPSWLLDAIGFFGVTTWAVRKIGGVLCQRPGNKIANFITFVIQTDYVISMIEM